MSAKDTLETCPFCGGEVVRMTFCDLMGGNPNTRYIGCKQCDMTVSFGNCRSEAELALRWNRRVR